MEEDGKIIGHVMFSKAEIILDDGTVFPSWTFGPISVAPEYKRKGYGLKLLNYALEKAKEMGIGLLSITPSRVIRKCLISLPKSSSQATGAITRVFTVRPKVTL